jgi:CheY-like chemotaxis protein
MFMPKLNGTEVHKFNQENQKIPFILLTGSSEHELKDIPGFTKENNCIAVGKPWQPEVLTFTVKVLLGIQ